MMEPSIMAPGKMANFTESALLNGLMDQSTEVNGKIAEKTVMENL